ncbi:UNVERIFIED_CONTAM: Copia protein [Sesamum radiatum]|uniref:Copia protein n=1 Tax=Sesamum radiatum TaxID=300843 RepID=A0AAW2PYT1_SESRA
MEFMDASLEFDLHVLNNTHEDHHNSTERSASAPLTEEPIQNIQKANPPVASTSELNDSRKDMLGEPSESFVPSVQEALENPKWAKAMTEEMEALRKNSTWEIVPLPKGKKTVGCRWVYTVKLKPDGSIDRYKARLVAKGYTQNTEWTIKRPLHQ